MRRSFYHVSSTGKLMILDFCIKPSTYVGLAVHHERLNLIKLKHTRKQIIIEGCETITLPAETVVDGKINYSGQLVQSIKRWVETNRAKHCLAALALPLSQVINKRIRVSACLNEEEQNVEINSNVKFYLPGMDERLYLDFVTVEKYEQEVELQLIAARAEQVETYLQLLQTAGLKVKIVDVDVYAIVRSIRWLSLHSLNQATVLLDRDVTAAQLILLDQGKVISIYPVAVDDELIMLQQIKRGMQIFLAMKNVNPIEKMLLTGCVKEAEKFQRLLQSELSLSVERVTSFKNSVIHSRVNSVEVNSCASEWLAAFGLALRGLLRD